MSYGQNAGELPFNVGKDIKAKWIYDVREMTQIHKFAGETKLQKRKGDTVQLTRLKTPDPITNNLEGAEEPGMSEVDYERLEFKLKRYSRYFPLYGHVVKTHDDDVLGMTMETSKEQATRSIETLSVDIITSGSQAFYATGTQTSHVKDYLRGGLLNVQQRYLETNETPSITKIQKSTSDFGTYGIDACFITFAPHELADDFRRLDGFVKVQDYSSRITPFPFEIGSYGRQRIICSGFFKANPGAGASLSSPEQADIMNTGGKADVFSIVTFGKDAFDFGGLQGEEAVKLTVYNAKPSDTDKNGNKGHISWLAWFGGLIKQQKYISRIECVAKTDSKLAA